MKEQGLEAQLLGIVVRKERPEVEESKDKLVVNIASSKKKLADLEDEILRFVPSWEHRSHFRRCTGPLQNRPAHFKTVRQL